MKYNIIENINKIKLKNLVIIILLLALSLTNAALPITADEKEIGIAKCHKHPLW